MASAAILAAAVPAVAAPTTLGDRHVTRSGVAAGGALACSVRGGPARETVPWIARGRVDAARRPVVGGSVAVEGAGFRLRRDGSTYAFTGTGLPTWGRPGAFPPAPGSAAARWSSDTAGPATHPFTGSFPAAPRRVRRPACVSALLPVAVARNGVPILPAFGDDGADLVARLPADACGGRTDASGRYAYRAAPLCLDGGSRRAHSRLLGYARDGHALFGPRGAGGRRVRSSDLDACHGHTHRVAFRSRTQRAYHYHATADFPHTVGCFRARPARDWQRGFPAPTPAAATPAAVAAVPAPSPKPDPTRLAITTTPGLQPSFDRGISDFVTRCDGTSPVRVDVAAPDGTSVAVDGAAGRSGAFSAGVPLGTSQRFAITVTGGGTVTTHHVRCLPADVSVFDATVAGAQQPAYYLVTPMSALPYQRYAVVVDRRGTPVWWRKTPSAGPLDFKLLSSGALGWFAASAGGEDFRFEDRALDGTLVDTTSAVGEPTDFHDLEELLPNGNRRVLVYARREHVDVSGQPGHAGETDAGVIDAVVQEVDPAGNLVWSWNSASHIGLEETGRWWDRDEVGQTDADHYDIVHVNSVRDDGDAILVSMRHTDAVYRVLKATGEIDWKLGGTTTAKSLGGDNAPDLFGGQHDARRLADGTVTVFDNGTALGRPPRAIRLAIAPVARTATVLETVAPPPDVPSSFCCGSAHRFSGGGWLISWGGGGHVTETAGDGSRVFDLRFGSGVFTYRVAPVMPGALSAAALRAGMDAQHPR